MEAVLNLTVPLSVDQLAALIRQQLPESERVRLAHLLAPDEEFDEPTQAQLVAEMKEAVREINLIKQGKIKARPVKELLDEL